MSGFEDREDAFEKKFAHDAELQFRVEARRNKLLGLWAAELMDLSGDAAQAFAMDVVKSDLEEAGDEDVYRKVAGALETRATEADIRGKMAALLVDAKQQIMSES